MKKAFLFVILSVQALAAPVSAWNFDWDDNIFFMPTRIYVFEKGTGKERAVSTTDFAILRENLGNYEIKDDPETGSFREFRDRPGRNLFLEHVKHAVETQDPKVWQGPVFQAFQTALSDPNTAKWTTIITAR